MVRAAVSGAVDYSRADPLDTSWRIKHRLLLAEMQRRESQHLLEYLHQHWCAYVAHGSLEAESFAKVKDQAADVLEDLQKIVFPWNTAEKPKPDEKEQKNSKIDGETNKLIERYKVWRMKKETGPE